MLSFDELVFFALLLGLPAGCVAVAVFAVRLLRAAKPAPEKKYVLSAKRKRKEEEPKPPVTISDDTSRGGLELEVPPSSSGLTSSASTSDSTEEPALYFPTPETERPKKQRPKPRQIGFAYEVCCSEPLCKFRWKYPEIVKNPPTGLRCPRCHDYRLKIRATCRVLATGKVLLLD